MIFTRSVRLFRTIDWSLFITKKRNYRVLICGAAGGVGQACALLLKQNELVTSLVLHDLSKITPAIAQDIDLLDSPSSTEGYTEAETEKAFKGTDVVFITAGKKSWDVQESESRNQLLESNAPILFDIAKRIVKYCPKAIVMVVSNPIDSVVPVVAEVLRRNNVFDPRKLFGVTSLDLCRAEMLAAEINKVRPEYQFVPVVGGHDTSTTVPLWSQAQPGFINMSDKDLANLTQKLRTLHLDVVKLKTKTSTLSMAYSGARFINNVLRGLEGVKDVVDYSYVNSNVTASPYFSSPLVLGKNGVECYLPVGTVSCLEKDQLEKAIPILIKHVKLGVSYVNENHKICLV